jgi:N-acetylglucosaminyl-diphospho-decaprenol L-rhamnosyltransferase
MNNKIITAIITVNYKTADLVIKLIESLEIELVSLGATHLFIVDNFSQDNSLDVLADYITINKIDWITLLPSNINGGFAAGNNLAIQYLENNFDNYEYVWFINPDTQVMQGAGKALLSFLDAENEDVAGSQMVDELGNTQKSSFNFPSVISEFCSGARLKIFDDIFRKHLVARKEVQINEETDWLSGASFMVTKNFITQVGYLDSNYFLYFEEVDYFNKAKQCGFKCWHIPESRVVHVVGASTGINVQRRRRPQYWFDSRRRYFLKNHSALKLLCCDLVFLLGYISWLIRKNIVGSEDVKKEPVFFLRDFMNNSALVRGLKIDK